jgi:hypothetical protein
MRNLIGGLPLGAIAFLPCFAIAAERTGKDYVELDP